jgi:hypothetical protein
VKERALPILSVAFRVMAIIWVAIVLAVALYAGTNRLLLVGFTNAAAAFVPSVWRGMLVFLIMAAASTALSHLCAWLSRRI